MQIRKMERRDGEQVLPLVYSFYNSSAVAHEVPKKVLHRTFDTAVSGDNILHGYVLEDDEGRIRGYSYVTMSYACEAGGRSMVIEDIYVDPACRGTGYGSKLFAWILEHYRDQVVRYRLETTDANGGAQALYRRFGFDYLAYRQMHLDKKDFPQASGGIPVEMWLKEK